MGPPTPQDTLEQYVQKAGGGPQAVRQAYRRLEEGEIELVDPNPPPTLLHYLARPDHSLWLWTAATLTAATLALIAADQPALNPLRYLIGTIYVLFLPGHLLVEALYPHPRSLTPLERLALSLGLSLAVVPLIGLLLNYTPWGIRLWPVALSLAAFNTAMMLTAAHRKLQIHKLVR